MPKASRQVQRRIAESDAHTPGAVAFSEALRAARENGHRAVQRGTRSAERGTKLERGVWKAEGVRN